MDFALGVLGVGSVPLLFVARNTVEGVAQVSKRVDPQNARNFDG